MCQHTNAWSMTASLAGGEDHDDMVFTQQPSEPSSFSIWLSEHAVAHCEEMLSAEGFESLHQLKELQYKDTSMIRALISEMKGDRKASL